MNMVKKEDFDFVSYLESRLKKIERDICGISECLGVIGKELSSYYINKVIQDSTNRG